MPAVAIGEGSATPRRVASAGRDDRSADYSLSPREQQFINNWAESGKKWITRPCTIWGVALQETEEETRETRGVVVDADTDAAVAKLHGVDCQRKREREGNISRINFAIGEFYVRAGSIYIMDELSPRRPIRWASTIWFLELFSFYFRDRIGDSLTVLFPQFVRWIFKTGENKISVCVSLSRARIFNKNNYLFIVFLNMRKYTIANSAYICFYNMSHMFNNISSPLF